MILEIRNRHTNSAVGYKFGCHGCGKLSDRKKTEKLPSKWETKLEHSYTPTGLLSGKGLVENYYCPRCSRI